MKYILMMHAPRGTSKAGQDESGDWAIMKWSPDALQNHIQFMHDLNKDLIAAGEFVGAEGLAPPGQAKLVRAGKKGEPITDGPFPETKEFLAGFWILDVDSAERAYEIAARASTAPGPDGKPLNMNIEVRQVMQAPTKDS
jgi:hypothetical protein